MLARILGLLVLGQTESLPALIADTAAAVESLPRPVPHPAAADATSRILGMDPTLFWGLVGAVVGVVGIIAAVCLYRRTAGKRQVEDVQKDMATKDQVEGVRKEMCARIDAISTALGAQLYADGLPSASASVRDPFKLGLTAMEQYKWDEAIGHFKDALKHASGTQLVALFNLIGICHFTPGRWPGALEAWEESERLARRFGDRKGEAAALGNIGLVWRRKGELDKALEYQRKALKMGEEMEDKQGEAQSLGNIGLIWQDKGDLDKALDSHKKALVVSEELGAKREQASVLGNIGNIWYHRGDLDKALEYQRKALSMRRELGMKLEEAQALANIGLIWHLKGDLDKALEYQRKALKMGEEMGDKAGVAQSLGNIGLVWGRKGELDKALGYHKKALEVFEELGAKQEQAQSLGNIGLIWQARAEGAPKDAAEACLDKALEYQEKSLALERELGNKQGEAQSLGNIGLVWGRKGELDKALGYHKKALEVFEELDAKQEQASVLGNIGVIWQARAEGAPKDAAEACLDKALECQQRSQAISVEGGYREGAATALLNMGSIFIHKQDWDKAVACYVPSLMEHIAMGIADGPKQCLSGLRMCYTALGEGRFVELCVEAGMEEEEAEAMVRAFEKKKPDSAPAQ